MKLNNGYKRRTLETGDMRDAPISLYDVPFDVAVRRILAAPPIKQVELQTRLRQRKVAQIDGNDLYTLIHKLVPASIGIDMREELESEIAVAIMEGRFALQSLHKIRYADFKKQVYAAMPDRFRNISIDAPINEEGMTLADVLEG